MRCPTLALVPLALALALGVGCSVDYGMNTYDDPASSPEDTGTSDPLDPPAPPDATEPEPQDEEEEEEEVEEEDPPEPPDETHDDDPPPDDDCDHTSDLVYVIDRADDALYLFDPDDTSFDFVGELDCGMWSGTPGSMAVSRDGHAYVRYSDDNVYAVDLETMGCTPTTYGGAFGTFGMGFATDEADTWRDALYVANSDQLATMDTGTWAIGMVGAMPSQSELTGNARGELWAFLPLETPAMLAEIDKASGTVVQTHGLAGFPSPYDIDAFAFATWRSEFWLFVRTYGMGQTTDVYRVDAYGNMTLAAPDTGMDIVGAGVSTCAPTE